MPQQYKVVETSDVTAETLEQLLNEWTEAGWVFDTTGSYQLAFRIFAGFLIAAIALVGALRLERGATTPSAVSDG